MIFLVSIQKAARYIRLFRHRHSPVSSSRSVRFTAASPSLRIKFILKYYALQYKTAAPICQVGFFRCTLGFGVVK
ncbi:hypothetical protein IB211_00199 [Intestinimonas butyriciproducens]|uniref:Uncharacterized protein n=1 Tax=Intestinimonas butyriciproducens TaxID=1297617 RepID=A0A0S2VZQ6_9FIRM|nr:hypothetical protein IB211_00199 [Intestinimonas butyriciproducens]